MTYFGLTPVALVYVILAGLLLHAAWTDLREMKILNNNVICVLAAAGCKYLLLPETFDWWDLGATALVFFGGILFLYNLMKFGAGDVKLLTALMLFFGYEHAFWLLAWTGTFGGLFSAFHILARRKMKYGEWLHLPYYLPYLTISDGKSFPYGIGIVPAAFILLVQEAIQLKVF